MIATMLGVRWRDAQPVDPDRPQGGILDRVPAVFYLVEHVGPNEPSRLRYLSPQVVDLTGYTADAFLADPTLEARIVHPEDRARKQAAELHHLTGGDPLSIDYRVVAADGAVVWVHDEAARLSVGADGGLFSHGMIVDVTRQKRLEARLGIQAQTLELVARNAPLPEILEGLVRLVDAEFDGTWASILLVEDGVLKPATTGRLPEAYIAALAAGVPIEDGAGTCGTAAASGSLVISDDIESDPRWHRYGAFIRSARDAGLRSCWATPIVSTDGSVLGTFALYRAVVHSPSDDEAELAGAAARVAALAIDRVREGERSREAEQAAASSEYRMRELLRRVTLAAVLLDRDGRIVFANDALVRSTGWAGRLAGRDWFGTFIPEESRTGEAARYRHGIELGRMETRFENEIVTRSGERRRYVWHTSVLRDRDGLVAGVASIGEDATERLRLEAQLRESQKQEAIGRLAGGIAHDFNNLLTAITGYADLLLSDAGADADAQEALTEIRRASERATALTRQLLAFARRQPFETRVVDVAEVVAGIEPLLQRIIGEDVELTTELEPGACVRVDPAQLEQVVVNLAVNARDAMPSGGALSMVVRAQRERRKAPRPESVHGDQVILRVTDSGEGMDPQTRAHAFEPFFTTKEQGRGTGLGLATVYGIVTLSGGTVGIESAVGRGTTVTVALPRVDAVAPEPEPAPLPAQAARQTGTILVVEDEDSVRHLVRRVLERRGFSVVDAATGAAAVDWAESTGTPIDLLITDVVMPGMNGREVADRLAALRSTLPVLFLSGYTADVLRGQLPLPPGQSFLAKPFSPGELAARVEAVLAETRGSRERAAADRGP